MQHDVHLTLEVWFGSFAEGGKFLCAHQKSDITKVIDMHDL